MHKHSILLITTFVVSLGPGVSAQVSPGRPAPVPSPRAGTPTETPDRSAMAMDEAFARKAASGSAAEVELAVVALQKASTDHVKQIAQRIKGDHRRTNDELMSIVSRKGLNIDPKPTADQIELRTRLEKLSGAEFDRKYIDEMVKDHQKDIKEFERQASDGTDPELKAFATKTLPDLKEHLKLAQEAQRALTSTSQ